MTKQILVLLYFFTASLSFAQTELQFEFDFARFKYDNQTTYLEFYYELSPRYMKIAKAENGFMYEAIVHVELKNEDTQEFVINRDWKIQNSLQDTTIASLSKNLLGAFGIGVSAGNYSILVNAYDSNNKYLSKSISEKIKIDEYPSDKFGISDIQIATNIKHDGVDSLSIFYKNTLEVFPNPSMLFSNLSPVLFYYAELYNLKLPDKTKDFTLEKTLYNSRGLSVYRTKKPVKQSPNAVVDFGVINLSRYPTDSYNLILTLVDPIDNQAYASSKRFYLYNPGVIDSTELKFKELGYMGTEFGVFSSEDCDKMFKEIKYIATKAEIDKYAKTDSVSNKREFLYNFWLNRDADPATMANEYKDSYMKRVDFVNKKFAVANREGYQTDRGRVYLVYGEPDQRDLFSSERSTKPYEVWFYNAIENGVYFYFGDVTGFGNFELLHSTKRGEVRDDTWQRRLGTN
ncbi:MAG: GWxTD domain-containing protein [Melioribacteraceae bacterium]|nr:GWxTD domain-containing protein [Melioribacteraceae bacterium]